MMPGRRGRASDDGPGRGGDPIISARDDPISRAAASDRATRGNFGRWPGGGTVRPHLVSSTYRDSSSCQMIRWGSTQRLNFTGVYSTKKGESKSTSE
eukprot:767734-Hanusia_phi.AAC.5